MRQAPDSPAWAGMGMAPSPDAVSLQSQTTVNLNTGVWVTHEEHKTALRGPGMPLVALEEEKEEEKVVRPSQSRHWLILTPTSLG